MCAPDQRSGSACAEVVLPGIGHVIIIIVRECSLRYLIGIGPRRGCLNQTGVIGRGVICRSPPPTYWRALLPDIGRAPEQGCPVSAVGFGLVLAAVLPGRITNRRLL